jgi:hypothetical protein
MFLVTIADKSHLTTDQPQQINLSRIKRRLGAGLEACRITGIFWFGALPRNGLQNIWQKIKSRFTPIMPGLCAVHKKIIPRDQFGYRFGISSNHLVKNIPSASVVSATRKPERLNSSRIPESCVQEIE